MRFTPAASLRRLVHVQPQIARRQHPLSVLLHLADAGLLNTLVSLEPAFLLSCLQRCKKGKNKQRYLLSIQRCVCVAAPL